MKVTPSSLLALKPHAAAYRGEVEAMLRASIDAADRGPQTATGIAINTASLAIDMIVQLTAEEHGGTVAVQSIGFAFGSTIAQLSPELRQPFVSLFMAAVREASDVALEDAAAIDAAKAGAAGNA